MRYRLSCPVELTEKKSVNATHHTTCDSNFWLAGKQQQPSLARELTNVDIKLHCGVKRRTQLKMFSRVDTTDSPGEAGPA